MFRDSIECKCNVRTKCSIDQCECEGLCVTHQYLYEDIKKDLLHQCFLTWSPIPQSSAMFEFGINSDLDRFCQFHRLLALSGTVTHAIIVAELTQKGQIHFHAYCKFKSKAKFYRTIVQPLYYTGNVLPIYGPPKLGIHYLFKAHETMKEYLDDCPVRLILPDVELSEVSDD